ncbi:MAG: hypothetical protein ACRECX_05280 [Methyloceanibacter sp.]|uniref:hypothetical protein n=1 Tax=Methyloceanibacter sp. TaxID=1965321 RepID=UPI003D6CEC52
MTGDPGECRQNAERFLAFAQCAATDGARRELVALAETWLKLAAELESDERLLRAMSELEFEPPQLLGQAYEVLPQVLGIRSWAA